MAVHYYLSVFPTEALIASELSPRSFGAYMATGAKKGSAEQIVFIEIEGGFGSDFDWSYARERCVPHPNGEPKHSVYLSIYRTLEHVPLEKMVSLYLTTRDGRTLGIDKGSYDKKNSQSDFYVYQELCPCHPVVVSRLNPDEYGMFITNPDSKTWVPKILFADLKVIDIENPEQTGNIGSLYDRKVEHLKSCIQEIHDDPKKQNKTLQRTHVEAFTFQLIHDGIYISDGDTMIMYPMPDVEEIKRIDYDWGRSALII